LITALSILVLLVCAENENKINVQLEKYAAIRIDKMVTNCTESSDENASYLIKVENNGELELKNVKVVDTMPPGMKYKSSMYENSDEEFVMRWLDLGESGQTKNITWILGSLNTGQGKKIRLSVSKTKDANKWNYSIYAEGQALNNYLVSDRMNGTASIYVDQYYYQKNIGADETERFSSAVGSIGMTGIVYLINVKNGDTKLNNVWVNDTLPEMKTYISAGLYDKNTLAITKSLTPEEIVINEDGTARLVRLKLGDLEPGEEMNIKINVLHKSISGAEDKYEENIVEAKGMANGNISAGIVSSKAKYYIESELGKTIQDHQFDIQG